MSPPLGTLTSTGLFTAPALVPAPAVTVVTAKSIADPTAWAQIEITVLPSGTLRLAVGNSANYLDSQGNTWWGTQHSPIDAGWNYDVGGIWPAVADVALYEMGHYSNGDMRVDVVVPNGNYTLTAKMAETEVTSAGQALQDLEVQGQIAVTGLDVFASAGGAQKPFDVQLPATVTDGRLSFVVRYRGPSGHSKVSSLQIGPGGTAQRLSISPATPSATLNQAVQFFAIGWYTSSAVTWSISPQVGSIDSNGVYTGGLVSQTTTVTVTATSVASPALTAASTVTLTAPASVIRVNCGGGAFTDAQGNAWSADYGWSGSSVVYSESAAFSGTTPDMYTLYDTSRYSYSNQSFSYSFAAPNGAYKVTLKFGEYRTAQNSTPYNFDVLINGVQVLASFDPIAAAGGVNKVLDRSFNVTVTDNTIKINFVGKNSPYLGAMINGIEIVPAAPDTTPPSTPVNVTATASSQTQVNITWSASTDNVGVVRYQVFRNGALAGTTQGLSFTDRGLTPSTNYSYTIVALDSAGNASNPSAPALATTRLSIRRLLLWR